MRIRVVLPAPFGPTRAVTEPSGISMSTLSSAQRPGFHGLPNRFEMPWAWSGAPVSSSGPVGRAIRTRADFGDEARSARPCGSVEGAAAARADAIPEGRPQLVPDGAEASGVGVGVAAAADGSGWTREKAGPRPARTECSGLGWRTSWVPS